ncbi:hypothetical protein V8E51_001963 [Hyaloscypha variabilis]
MFEIDHTALLNPDQPPPEPAKPILASQLLELEKKQRRRFTKQGKDERISTGCGEIDEVLGGGCERGIVVGISAEGVEGLFISLHLLASIVLSNLDTSPQSSSEPKATIIDTTGSFQVSLLANVIKSRLLSSRAASATVAVRTANYAISSQEQEVRDEDVGKEVQRCLEMVAISRVFDIEGLREVLGEVARDDTLHDGSNLASSIGQETNKENPQKPTEILDSEDDFTPEEVSPIPPLSPAYSPGTEIIIIDNLTHLINSHLAQKEKTEAHAFLNLLSLTLHNMTHTSNILTIVHNTTNHSKLTSTSTSNHTYPTTTAPHKQHSRQPQITNPSSIFPSNSAKPALGQIFTQFPELHLLVSRLPTTRGDAEVLYGQDEESLAGYQKEVRYCFVVEVLKDETPNLGLQVEEGDEKGKGKGKGDELDAKRGKRFGWREQRWTAVDVAPDGAGFVGAFQVKGNMRGMGLEREKIGGLKDVGHIAKMYGFGGRRV